MMRTLKLLSFAVFVAYHATTTASALDGMAVTRSSDTVNNTRVVEKTNLVNRDSSTTRRATVNNAPASILEKEKAVLLTPSNKTHSIRTARQVGYGGYGSGLGSSLQGVSSGYGYGYNNAVGMGGIGTAGGANVAGYPLLFGRRR